jgi:hypothetical protein
MTEEALQALNPERRLPPRGPEGAGGQCRQIRAALGGAADRGGQGRKAVRVYGADRKLLAFYPATIGSSTLPTPAAT